MVAEGGEREREACCCWFFSERETVTGQEMKGRERVMLELGKKIA